jgi:hypothetical protein
MRNELSSCAGTIHGRGEKEYHLLFEPQSHQIKVQVLEDKKKFSLDAGYRRVIQSLL